MRRLGRWLAYAVAAIASLALLALAVLWSATNRVMARHYARSPEAVRARLASDAVREGGRLAHVLGCQHCHGEGLQGRLFFDEPHVARLYAPNLTLLAREASDEQLAQAIRQGVLHDGRGGFAMPSQAFVALTDEELGEVLGFIRSLPVAGERTPPLDVGLLGRIGIATGEFEPAPVMVARARRATAFEAGAAFAAGRHTALVACSECHGPELAGSPSRGDVHSPPDLTLATGYPAETFRGFLRSGRAIGDRELSLMSETARARFTYLTDAEIDGLYAYLAARAAASTPMPGGR
jgi:mono/diheme cytochrome c family protein